MSCARFFLFTALAAAGVTSVRAGEPIPFVPMQLCSVDPATTPSTSWDQTGQFCFEANQRREVYPFADLGVVTLRRGGQWVAGPYLDALTDADRNIVAQYDTYVIRHLALGPADADGSRSFVVQVDYNWAWTELTTFAFGQIGADGHARLTGFSDAGAKGSAIRPGLKTLAHLLAIFHGENPNRVAVNEGKAEDRARVKPTVGVIDRFRARGTGPTKP